jgi:hypothetical protein
MAGLCLEPDLADTGGIWPACSVGGAVVLLVHFVEHLFVRSKVAERQGGNTGFIGTMVFGFGYWLPVLKGPQGGE